MARRPASAPFALLLAGAAGCTFNTFGLGADAGEASAGTDGSTSAATSGTTAGATGGETEGGSASMGTTAAGACGDGSPGAGEECDQGPLNADDGECKSDCTWNVCGDGHVGPEEG